MRYFWLALFLLLTSVALADSIDFQGAGTLSAGTVHLTGRLAPGHTWGAQTELIEIDNLTTGKVTSGMLGTLDIVTGTLHRCASGLCFSGGLVDIDGNRGGSIFDQSLLHGTVTLTKSFDIISATMSNGAAVLIKGNRTGAFSTQVLAATHGAVVPEPATLGMLGTGLLGLGLLRVKRRA